MAETSPSTDVLGDVTPMAPPPSRRRRGEEVRSVGSTDRRHPVRSAVALLVLALLASVALAAAVALAVAAVALATRRAVG